MPAPRRSLALLVTVCLAAAPSAAVAQNGAGDQQYSDPFASPTTTAKPKAQAAPAPAQTPAAPQTAATPSAPAASAPAAATAAPAASGPQLPRTGFDVLPVALLGAALIAAGLVLLRRRGAHGP